MSINTCKKGVPLAVVRGSRRQVHDGKLLHISENPDDGVEEYNIMDGTLGLLPPDHGRAVVYAFGPSGSGKSTFIAGYVDEWRKKNPKKPIIVFSRLDEDEVLDELGVDRMIIDDSLLEEPITASEFEPGSMLIFDDIDSIQPDRLKKAVYALLTDCLNTGRHNALSVCITSHNGTDGAISRNILNECHYITVYPHGSSFAQIKYILQRYVGLTNEKVREALRLRSRWVCFRRQYPPCVIHQNGVYMLAKETDSK